MPKADLKRFDYQKVALLDTEMWRSYYNHQFFRLFWQLLILTKTQLGLNWFTTLRLASYSAWAAADYRLHRGNVNRQRVLGNLVKFYKIVSNNALERFDYEKTGELELKWWDIHRSSHKNNYELEQSLAEAAAAMYNLESTQLQKYAHYRAEAMILPRHGSNKANSADWERVHKLLIKAWSSLHSAVQNSRSGSGDKT